MVCAAAVAYFFPLSLSLSRRLFVGAMDAQAAVGAASGRIQASVDGPSQVVAGAAACAHGGGDGIRRGAGGRRGGQR